MLAARLSVRLQRASQVGEVPVLVGTSALRPCPHHSVPFSEDDRQPCLSALAMLHAVFTFLRAGQLTSVMEILGWAWGRLRPRVELRALLEMAATFNNIYGRR